MTRRHVGFKSLQFFLDQATKPYKGVTDSKWEGEKSILEGLVFQALSNWLEPEVVANIEKILVDPRGRVRIVLHRTSLMKNLNSTFQQVARELKKRYTWIDKVQLNIR